MVALEKILMAMATRAPEERPKAGEAGRVVGGAFSATQLALRNALALGGGRHATSLSSRLSLSLSGIMTLQKRPGATDLVVALLVIV